VRHALRIKQPVLERAPHPGSRREFDEDRSCDVFRAQAGRSSPGSAAGPGLGLAPNGMNVLAALGVAERLKAGGSLALESDFRDERGRLLAQLSIEERPASDELDASRH
jgi:hypothetical protein